MVTGASVGIGKAVATRLAADGFAVAIRARDEGTLKAAAAEIDGEVLAIPIDVTDHADVEQFVTETADTFGGIDVLVNNVGIVGGMKLFEVLNVDDWHDVFDVNIYGMVRVTRAALSHLRDGDNRYR